MLATIAALALVATSAAALGAADPPQMIHIALAGNDGDGNPNAMAISWNTNNQTNTSVCQYSTDASLRGANVTVGTQSSYYATWQHHAVTHALKYSTQYFYRCGDSFAGFSGVFNFTTSGGPSQESITVLQVGDMGVYNSWDNRQLIDQLAPSADMLMWSGDICYADDAFLHDPLGFGYELTWDVCQTWLENVTTSTPFMTAPGNHEAECHSPACLLDEHRKESLHNFSAYTHRFRMPSAESLPSPGTLNQWYSYTMGPVRFIHHDSETSYPNSPNDSYTGLNNGPFGDQLAWVKSALEFANTPEERAKHPWVIVTAHRPLYSLAECEDDGQQRGSGAVMSAAFEDLYYQNNVDVHISGHVHAYERQHPVYRNKLTADAPTYIVSGAGGNSENHSHLGHKPGALWSAYSNDEDFGIGIFTVTRSSFEWKYLRGAGGAVLDSVTLTK
ncbi:hypothetical protein FNF27_05155 [Cafeteria roenbergensis]|uniref:Purple acid phosphatase n=1 Tax=Cafeteria roenbergensis TaxID=33653 RepID=A0A5A8E7U5_CAFRO|nr:hypothetical protein FNF29_06046 [Cafeteria roenbergensis]KAA0173378.1 hypothetical protein FNF27_05155 [Cafeteria roenbergensis]|eukprot:KAA0149341.1 hypothetical protein FNF29_06046 [Cafeteria roenbergensis]